MSPNRNSDRKISSANTRFGLHSRKRESSAKLNDSKARAESPFIQPVPFPEFEADDSYEEMKMEEVFRSGDIFETDDEFAVARFIVSSDPSLSSSVQKRYRDKFTHIDQLPRIQLNAGSVAVFKEGNRFMYYLAVKDRISDRFSYANFVSCLENVRDHVIKENIKRVALSVCDYKMNKMCWPTLRRMLIASFDDIGIEELVVYRGQRNKRRQQESSVKNT